MKIAFLLVIWFAAASAAGREASLLPDRETVLGLAAKEPALKPGGHAEVKILDVLPDGRVPAVVLILIPREGKREAWEEELDLLEKNIALLEAELAEAGDDGQWELAKKLQAAKEELEWAEDRAVRQGKNLRRVKWRSVELAMLVFKKAGGKWTLYRTLVLGSYEEEDLGAKPAGVDMEVRLHDYNRNSISELKLTTFVELNLQQVDDSTARTHTYHHLVEFFPEGAQITFQLDGGVDNGGMCEGPFDSMTTAKYWIRSPKRDPAALTVSRTRSMCDQGEQANDPARDLPAVERYAWSDKYRRWQPHHKLQPDAFMLVAASGRDRSSIQKKAKRFRHWKVRQRVRLGRAYPKLVETEDFPGLKAGYQLLVLGVCKEYKLAREAMRKIRKKVKGGGLRYDVRGFNTKGSPKLPKFCPRPR